MKLRVLSLAETDVMEAALWYESRQSGLGLAFWSAVDVAYRRIRSNPGGFPLWEDNQGDRPIRRMVLKQFPYVIYFEKRTTETLVVAVSHASRSPDHWLSRLGNPE
ncbi:MAG: type II toxin-antitoxin system RelE/ParE family toxin [Planctomycetaceae bacterium]